MCLIEYWLSCYFTLYHLTSFRLESKLLVPAYCLLSASAVSLFIIRLTEYIPAPLTESGFTVWHCKYIENFLKIHIPQYIWNGLELIGIRWNKISLIFPKKLSDKSVWCKFCVPAPLIRKPACNAEEISIKFHASSFVKPIWRNTGAKYPISIYRTSFY